MEAPKIKIKDAVTVVTDPKLMEEITIGHVELLNKEREMQLITDRVSEAEKTIRKASTTTTIKSFNTSVAKLIVLKMVTDEEYKQLKELQKTIFERWVAVEMNL